MSGGVVHEGENFPCLHCGLFCCVLGGSAEQLRGGCFEMSWLPLFTEEDIGNREVEIMGLIDPLLPTPVRVQCTMPCVIW